VTARPASDVAAPARVLVVEDERIVARHIEESLNELGYRVVGLASSGEEAIRKALELEPTLVLMDIHLRGDMDGITTAHFIREQLAVPIIFLTAFSDVETLRRASATAPYGYVVKPFTEVDLRCAIEIALIQHQQNAELQDANRDLEAFSDSVSHDLRAPLGRIDGFSKALLEDHGEDLGEPGRRYLQRVRAATERMDDVIVDLLRLARLAGTPLQRADVDLSALARAVGAVLRETQPARTVEFIVHDGLRARCDSGLLRLVLENLLGNAWKFTAKKPGAQIEFGSRAAPDGSGPVFFVRDDGVGFDPAQQSRLFLPFQRLHGAGEFDGNGIGLTTVQRIIRRHGGRVWAEGQPGQGATFYFTVR
jgi:two-component system, sensor histidine kinase and response regulator